MFLRLSILLSVVAAVFSITIDDCPWFPDRSHLRAFGNSCYLFYSKHEKEFQTAQIRCRASGGHLAIIRDMETQSFLYNMLKNDFGYDGVVWIGLSDQQSEGHFVWVDGTPANFTYWASGQNGIFGSAEDCVAIDTRKGGRWHDYHCEGWLFSGAEKKFICEYPPQPTTTTPKPTTPQPTTTTPKPTTPQPTTTTPNPTTPQPTTTTPKPTTPQPTTTMPKTTTLQPTTTTPNPTTPQPTTATPKPSTPQPTTTTPKPTTSQPTTTTSTSLPTEKPTTSTTKNVATGEAECPPFDCTIECGLAGYAMDSNNCLMCQCFQ